MTKKIDKARRDRINYYLDIADAVTERSTCLRRKWGAVIVKDDEIISTGYNGAPRGRKNCTDIGTCIREELNIPRGTRYELCRSVHAEANAIAVHIVMVFTAADVVGVIVVIVATASGMNVAVVASVAIVHHTRDEAIHILAKT